MCAIDLKYNYLSEMGARDVEEGAKLHEKNGKVQQNGDVPGTTDSKFDFGRCFRRARAGENESTHKSSPTLPFRVSFHLDRRTLNFKQIPPPSNTPNHRRI